MLTESYILEARWHNSCGLARSPQKTHHRPPSGLQPPNELHLGLLTHGHGRYAYSKTVSLMAILCAQC